jgi:hypothetical protein
VFLPVREPAARSREWAKARGLAIPIADGGPAAAKDGAFLLADGRRIGDRDVARVFPTTYVLDRHGLVLFAHAGPVGDWGRPGALAGGRGRGTGAGDRGSVDSMVLPTNAVAITLPIALL